MPLADVKENTTNGAADNSMTLLEAISKSVSPSTEVLYFKGCNINDTITPNFDEAVAISLDADVIVMFMGEDVPHSTESSYYNTLPGKQEELIKVLMKTGKPVIVVMINKHIITNSWIAGNVPVIIEARQFGSDIGNKIAKLLLGK